MAVLKTIVAQQRQLGKNQLCASGSSGSSDSLELGQETLDPLERTPDPRAAVTPFDDDEA